MRRRGIGSLEDRATGTDTVLAPDLDDVEDWSREWLEWWTASWDGELIQGQVLLSGNHGGLGQGMRWDGMSEGNHALMDSHVGYQANGSTIEGTNG